MREIPQTVTYMKYFHFSAALALLCAAVLSPVHATESMLTTPRGALVEMLVDLPDGTGPHAVLVLAPGQGYHARLPLMERLSKDLVARGVAVVRFNWAYFVKDPKVGKPADNLSSEIEDMQTVLAATKKLARIDGKRIAVGGKSLGSLVSWRVFRDDASLRAAALLTPVCTDYMADGQRDATLENYPNLSANTRPLLLLSGDEDPLCPNRFLYTATATIAAGARVVVAGGDHGFATKNGADPKLESNANLDAAIRITTEYVTAKLR
jgi:predicted alpha/beta-hydrolase family hydrolase